MKIPKNINFRTNTSPPKDTINLQVLNVGEGDLKVSFDKNNAQERTNAKKMIEDLMRQGFAIMVEVGRNEKGPIYQRAVKFDYKTEEYLVLGTPNVADESTKSLERVSMANRPTVAVARSAGGYDPIILSRIQRGGNVSTLRLPE